MTKENPSGLEPISPCLLAFLCCSMVSSQILHSPALAYILRICELDAVYYQTQHFRGVVLGEAYSVVVSFLAQKPVCFVVAAGLFTIW